MTIFTQNDLSRYSGSSKSLTIGSGPASLPLSYGDDPFKRKYMKPMICANGGKLNYWISGTSTNTVHNTTTRHKTALNANYSDIKIQYANWWVSNSGEFTSNVSPMSIQASVQIGSTIYQGVSKLYLQPGESGLISINNLSLPAGTEFFIHTHVETESGKVVCRGKGVQTSPMFDTGSLTGTDPNVNIAVTGVPYGAAATATVTSGSISALTLTSGGGGFLNTADVYAYETQSNGLLAKKLIGSATVSGGVVTSLTLTDGTPPSGVAAWVTPSIAISHGGLMTLTAHTTNGPIPSGIIGTPSVPVRAVMGVGGTDMYGSEQNAIADVNHNIGSFEMGIKNRCGFASCGVSAVKAQDFVNLFFNKSLNLYAPYVTDCIMHFGNFDVINSRTASQIKADIATVKSRINTTLNLPVAMVSEASLNTGGTYATLAGQTNGASANVLTSYSLYLDVLSGVIPSDLAIIDYGTMMRAETEPTKWDVTFGAATTGGIAPADDVANGYCGYSRAILDTKFQACFNQFSYINTVKPVISGTLADGGILTVTRGTWTGSPPLSYKWYRNGVEIPTAERRQYTMTSADVGQAITVKEIPSTYELAGVMSNQAGVAEKVTRLTYNNGNGDSKVTLSWNAPTAYTYPVTDYRVDYKLRSSSVWTTFSHSASTTTNITVTGLTNGSLYDFRVAAVTSIGLGEFSSIVSIIPYAILNKIADASLLGYYDSGLTETVISANGTLIETWNDISGSKNNLVQATAGDKPSKGVKTINSLGAVDFNGSTNYFSLPSNIVNTLGVGDCSMFFVYQLDTPSTTKTNVLLTDSNSNFFVYVRSDLNDVITKSAAGLGSSVTLTANTNVHIVAVRRASNVIKIYADGGAGGATSAASDVTATNMYLGRLHSSYGQIDGAIPAMALYDSALSITRFNEVGAALAARFGTTWTNITS